MSGSREVEIVAYCPLKEKYVSDVSLAVTGETVMLRQCGSVHVLRHIPPVFAV